MDTPRTEEEKRAPQPHVRRVTALDEWFDGIFEWISENSTWTLSVLGVGLTLGAVAAGFHEWNRWREESAQGALAAVERENRSALDPTAQPANEETARELRERALTGFESVLAEHTGTLGAGMAAIRAANLEASMDRFQAADARLVALLGDPELSPLLRAIGLRLHGYVLERLDRAAEAGEAYAQAATIEGYPGRSGAFLQAAETFERVGDAERAIALYEALTVHDGGFAERSGVVDRLQNLRGSSPELAPPPASGVSEPAGSGSGSDSGSESESGSEGAADEARAEDAEAGATPDVQAAP